MKYIQWIPLFLGLTALPVASALAAPRSPVGGVSSAPATLSQLLNAVKADLNRQTAVDKARVRKFLVSRDQQKALLNRARGALATESARTKRMQDLFNTNEKTLESLTTTLHAREGNLGEVFGTVRQVAGQFVGSLRTSIVSAQYPHRSLFAVRLAASKALPSIRKLKKLWYGMLQEMVEQGQVVKFSTAVTLVNGTKVRRNVVRVGTFNVVMGGKYLQYEPSSSALVVIARQPAGRFTSSAAALSNASGGLVGFGIDPLRGQLLTLLIQVPTFLGRVREGGTVGYSILVLFALALLAVLERVIALGLSSIKIKRQLKSGTPNMDNALGRVLAVYDQNRKDDVETLTLKLDEAIMKEVPTIESWQNFIKLIAAIGPLLGLLGTVIGMIQTFTSITLFGTGNPAYMAQGISYALVTTVEGLVTAIPLVALHSWIQSMSRKQVQILEEQSAGIIAAQAEKTNR